MSGAARDRAVFFVNGERHEVGGEAAFQPLANYLREDCNLTGTKIVCAEGDCGACTVLMNRPGIRETALAGFRGINSCILPVFLADGAQLVTVDGLAHADGLTEVQSAMVRCFGSQCGFCTPGFVMALTDMFERGAPENDQDVKNHLTGNLCRCTGYDPIIKAARDVDPSKVTRVAARYNKPAIVKALNQISDQALHITADGFQYYGPTSLADALQFKAEHPKVRIYSGATDLGVGDNKRAYRPELAMSLHLIPELYDLKTKDGVTTVGAKINLRQLAEHLQADVPKLAEFMGIFASPQIKESATLVGNLVNGSPIADTLPFLFVCQAEVHLQSQNGERRVAIQDFFKGYKDLDIAANELVTAVSFTHPTAEEELYLYKVSQRRDLDISCVNMAARLSTSNGKVNAASVCFGGVGPTPLRVPTFEQALAGCDVNETAMAVHFDKLQQDITPIGDVRGTAAFRRQLAANLVTKMAREAQHGAT